MYVHPELKSLQPSPQYRLVHRDKAEDKAAGLGILCPHSGDRTGVQAWGQT